MTTPNTPSPPVADAEPRPAAGQDDRRRPPVSWQEYTLAGAVIATTAGTLMVLWGSAQDSLAFLLSGAALFLAGFLGWVGVFTYLTWQLGRWLAPLLVARLRKSVRKPLPNGSPNDVKT